MSNRTHDFDAIIDRRNTDAVKFSPDICPPDVIPLWVADTDFKCPQELIDAMAERVALGHYGYTIDDPAFGRAVAGWMRTRFNWDVKPEWVMSAPGAMPPLLYGLRSFSAPGDKVLLQTPVYHPFYPLIENNGRRVIKNPLRIQNGRYEIDFENLEQGLADPRTRIMILCNPHNPTGRCFTREELHRIADLCEKHDVYVMSDEIHSDIVYPGHTHIPFPALGGDVARRSLVTLNPSKTFNMAGLHTAAFICEDDHVRQMLLNQRDTNKSAGLSTFAALAMRVLYEECGYYADQLVDYMAGNIQLVRESLRGFEAKISFLEPEATYLIWLDCRGMGLSQEQLVDFFIQDAKLFLNDGTMFGPEGTGFMRMNVASPRATIRAAMDRLAAALKKR